MGLHNAARAAEPESSAFGFGCEIRRKNSGAGFRRNTHAGIFNCNHCTIFFFPARNLQHAALGHGLDGIENNIAKRAAQIGGVGQHGEGQRHAGLQLNIDPGGQQGPGQFQGFPQDLGDIHWQALTFTAANIFAHPLDDFGAAARGILNRGKKEAALVVAGVLLSLHHHRCLGDGAQYIADVMGNIGGHLADSEIAFGILQAAL